MYKKQRHYQRAMLASIPTRWAPPRERFIEALNTEVPQAWQDLMECFENFLSLDDLHRYTKDWDALNVGCERMESKNRLVPLRKQLHDWAKLYHLDPSVWEIDPNWILDTALYTLSWCRKKPAMLRDAEFFVIYGRSDLFPQAEDVTGSHTHDVTDVSFTTMRFDPTIFSFDSYKKYALKDIGELIDRYLENIENVMVETMYEPIPKLPGDYVYNWLVRKQVLGRDASQIIGEWSEERGWHISEYDMKISQDLNRQHPRIPAITEEDNKRTERQFLGMEETLVRSLLKEAAYAVGLNDEIGQRGRPKKR